MRLTHCPVQVAYATATEDMVQLRKSFTTVGLMARVLSGRRAAPVASLQTWVRHAYVKAVTGQVLAMAKGLKGTYTKDWYALPHDPGKGQTGGGGPLGTYAHGVAGLAG